MSQEITCSFKLSVLNGGVNGSTNDSFRPTQTTAGVVQRRQSIPTADTVITLTGITAPRWIRIKNTDATNYVDIGITVAGAIVEFARLQPGESFPLPLFPASVLRAKAHTGACIIEIMLLET